MLSPLIAFLLDGRLEVPRSFVDVWPYPFGFGAGLPHPAGESGAPASSVRLIEVTDASGSRRPEIQPRIRQQGYGCRRVRIAARSVFARDRRHRLPEEAVSRRPERPHGIRGG